MRKHWHAHINQSIIEIAEIATITTTNIINNISQESLQRLKLLIDEYMLAINKDKVSAVKGEKERTDLLREYEAVEEKLTKSEMMLQEFLQGMLKK